MMDVYVIGIGPGNPAYLTERARSVIAACPVLAGDRRMLAPFEMEGKQLVATYKMEELRQLAASLLPDGGPLAILVSGDVGFYSLAALVKDLPGCRIHRIPGISSLVYFASLLQTNWHDAYIVSRHGRCDSLTEAVRHHGKVFCLTGGSDTPAALCQTLCHAGLGQVRVAVGCRLSYEDEQVTEGTAEELAGCPEDDSLAVMMIWNDGARPWQRPVHGLPDESFIRGNAPMTKQEIRSIALSRLAPSPDAVVYDIGAGTGSCTVELALLVPMGEVFAFEIDDEARTVLDANIDHFSLTNVTVVAGNAARTLPDVTAVPDAVFIGGTKGNISAILDEIYRKNTACRIVMTAITIETLAAVTAYYAARHDYILDITQVMTARSRHIGSSHMMMAQNPVYIMTAVCKTAPDGERRTSCLQ